MVPPKLIELSFARAGQKSRAKHMANIATLRCLRFCFVVQENLLLTGNWC
jgi:hypothetical protein